MKQQFYQIHEESTQGWELIDSSYSHLTKDECKVKIEFLLSQGYNPERLRVVAEL